MAFFKNAGHCVKNCHFEHTKLVRNTDHFLLLCNERKFTPAKYMKLRKNIRSYAKMLIYSTALRILSQ